MIKGKPYLRSKSIIEEWPCLSFYSASELTEGKVENGVKIYDMAKDYIKSFCKGETFESMQRKPLKERMSMVVFMDTDKFMRRVRGYFGSLGLKEHQDFYLNSVNYRTKDAPFVIENSPQELFSKESKFRKQQEFRIILNPYNQIIRNLLEDGHRIRIGSLTSCAMLKTNFYDGATIKVEDEGKRLSIEALNQHMWTGPLFEWTLEAMLPFMHLAYHTTKCVMDGVETDIDAFWREVTIVLANKYSIEVRHEPFDDQKDDHCILVFHGDSREAIGKNEQMDSCYYLKDYVVYKAPVFQKLLGGWPSGLVNFSAVVKSRKHN